MSGKSHERAEAVVEAMIMNPSCKVVCIREIQKSLKFSAKALIEKKILDLGVSHLFDVQSAEIKSKLGNGVCIFQGMQDHTADSIKSLEDFDIAWIEEAQSLSAKSLKLLRPTIVRKAGAEIWATWNPDMPEDAIEVFAASVANDPNAIVIHVNYDQNPFLDQGALDEIAADKKRYPLDFDHVYLGEYNYRSDVRVFSNWTVEECEPTFDDVLYYGADWGFAQDPTVLLRSWIDDVSKRIYVDYEISKVGVETDCLPKFFQGVPESSKYVIMGDSARPETISYLNRHGYNVKGVLKGKGSVEDGVDWLRGYEIVVHPRCKELQKELRLYSYKVDKNDNILPKIEDSYNHCVDALRYAYENQIRKTNSDFIVI